MPVILGTQPELAGPDTAPFFSPPWAIFDASWVFVPDIARGSVLEFFNFISGLLGNGDGTMQRKVYAKFSNADLDIEFRQWAANHPTLALLDPPGAEAIPPA
jgi:hypothetical protein